MTEASVTEISQYRDHRNVGGSVGSESAWVLPDGLPAAPPTGAVTFLLTDIEGSTERWESHREAMTTAVARHYEILDAAVTCRGGVRPVEQGEGDSMVAAFARASDALAAALDAQRALVAEGWPVGADLSVRMALHTGEAQLRENLYYVGPSIIRCARLRSLAHGGQVLVSTTTADLLADGLGDDTALLPLGTHRLKGLRRPERVFQLAHPALPAQFPPLRSLDALPNNLPVALTSFVGREAELAELVDLMGRHRLVTLVGPGGCGKTRLAAQAAGEAFYGYPDGVWWVELATVSDPAFVPLTVMGALGLDAKGLDPLDRIAGYLDGKRALVVLDNCEHVVAAAARFVERLLLACPEVVGLATSREPLGSAGEATWRVDPLELPDLTQDQTTEGVLATEAVRLFLDRAAAARPDFRCAPALVPTVAAICTRLDGIPLAIELAAARIRVLSPDRLLASLTDRFLVLTGGSRTAAPRQQTLAASVEWSHDLLADAERVLLRRLAVFTGSFDLEAAEQVASGGTLAAWEVLTLLSDLVDKSLVVFDGERYRLLQTIRDFAALRLEAAAEGPATRDAHLAHYRGLAAVGAVELEAGPQVATLERLEAAHENLLTAVDWALAAGDSEAALRMCGDLALFWQYHGWHSKSLVCLRRALAQAPADPTPLRARALWALGQLGLWSMDLPGGYGTVETGMAIELARTAGLDDVLGRALGTQGFVGGFADPVTALKTLAEAREVALRAGDRYGAACASAYAALVAIFGMDRPDLAEPRLADLAAEAVASGSALWSIWHGLAAGVWAGRAGRPREAAELLGAADELAWELGDPSLESWCAVWLADALIDAGDFAGAERAIARSAAWMDRSSFGRYEFVVMRRARSALVQGDLDGARRGVAVVETIARAWGIPFLNAELGLIQGRLGLAEGDLGAARAGVAEVSAVAELLGTPWYVAHAANLAGRLARTEGDPSAAEDAHHRALAICIDLGFDGVVAEALECLASLAGAGESWAEAARLHGAAGALRVHAGVPPPRLDAGAVGADLSRARAELGDEAYDAALAAGGALTLDEAVAYASRARSERRRPSRGWDSLTPMELQVVALAAEGLGNIEIGRRLFVRPGTVKVHLHHVFGKLGVTRRAELAARATERRLAAAATDAGGAT
jgi:predicted ATPase/class 3 adenylate cyclase/DNA-binding NarL/FixJ family response regulator